MKIVHCIVSAVGTNVVMEVIVAELKRNFSVVYLDAITL